jgi:hypothetical protein
MSIQISQIFLLAVMVVACAFILPIFTTCCGPGLYRQPAASSPPEAAKILHPPPTKLSNAFGIIKISHQKFCERAPMLISIYFVVLIHLWGSLSWYMMVSKLLFWLQIINSFIVYPWSSAGAIG